MRLTRKSIMMILVVMSFLLGFQLGAGTEHYHPEWIEWIFNPLIWWFL